MRGDGTPAEEHEVDVQQPHQIRGATPSTRAASPTAPRSTARHNASMQPRVAAAARGPVQLDDLMPELPRPGTRPPVHAPTDHEPRPEPRTEMQIGEGFQGAGGHIPRFRCRSPSPPPRSPYAAAFVSLSTTTGTPSRPRQRVPQREPVPLGNPVTRCSTPRTWSSGPGRATPTPSTDTPAPASSASTSPPPTRRPPPPRPHQRNPPLGDHRAGEVAQHDRHLVAVEVEPDRVPGLGHEPQHGPRLAAGATRGAPLPASQPVRPQPRR